ncbi:cleavage stimulation factor subunit 2 tau variant [Bradysia coprophila]|uniref:cleavage stimulation factor subunit 2 tau variant n=1 Tax=Bradysia coprophila TaxID=38358 RepID=UPI00187D857F|nr:cleavage stimulation factor subunit 2 tau variant [Bradysia coprophila]
MVDKNSDQSIMDKSMRSVFVGNIPYEATEEKLKEIFCEVGPVVSLKLVFDRESGKPKGYGFCEYKDQETALSAMRNLNGYEIGGRTLRVDNACTEKSRMEMQQLLQGPQVENPYGEHCEPENAPEAITKTVASLPPEQMYELMKQMKYCIQNNPTEARQMLLLNPQLAYALLQAQVVMRIIDPQTALGMLHKPNQMPPVLTSSTMQLPVHDIVPQIPLGLQAAAVQPAVITQGFPSANQDVDLRSVMDPRLNRSMDQDMRALPTNPMIPNPIVDPSFARQQQQQQQQPQRPVAAPVHFPTDPRQRPNDPRVKSQQHPTHSMQPTAPPAAPMMHSQPTQAQSRLAAGIPSNASDQEKAALIMQVLQLSDEQIAMLPPDQRASILVLKEQIAKSTNQH